MSSKRQDLTREEWDALTPGRTLLDLTNSRDYRVTEVAKGPKGNTFITAVDGDMEEFDLMYRRGFHLVEDAPADTAEKNGRAA